MRLSPGRRVVDADHAGADTATEPENSRRVIGVDRRRQTVTRCVGQFYGLIEVPVGGDADDRAEGLLIEHLVTGPHPVNDHRVIVQTGFGGTDEPVPRPGRVDPPDRRGTRDPVMVTDAPEGALETVGEPQIEQRPVQDVREGVTDGRGLHRGHEPADELVAQRSMHDHRTE